MTHGRLPLELLLLKILTKLHITIEINTLGKNLKISLLASVIYSYPGRLTRTKQFMEIVYIPPLKALSTICIFEVILQTLIENYTFISSKTIGN